MIVNLTPHAVSVLLPNGDVNTYPASGLQARASISSLPLNSLADGSPVSERVDGAPVWPELPPDTTAVIVSTIVADRLALCPVPGNIPVLVPDSGPDAVRENGQIKHVRRFFLF